MNDDIKISKNFTVGNWKELRKKLLQSDSDQNWDKAIKVFQDRIDSRFLDPIEKIKKNDVKQGEGFSITALTVILCEFLAAFNAGKIYKVAPSDDAMAPNEYSSSAKLFSDLFKTDSFKDKMNSDCKGRFYGEIRCGLIHEARTKGNSVIISKDSNKEPNEENQKKIYYKQDGEYRFNRDLFLDTLKSYIKKYREKLKKDRDLKKKFILKFDELADLKHKWYFIYGSNLLSEKLNTRFKNLSIIELGRKRVRLEDYRFVYNKASVDGSSKGNIDYQKGESVEGIAVLILECELLEFGKKYEKGYTLRERKLKYTDEAGNNKLFPALTFISSNITDNPPTAEYVKDVVDGAKEQGLPESYIRKYLNHKQRST